MGREAQCQRAQEVMPAHPISPTSRQGHLSRGQGADGVTVRSRSRKGLCRVYRGGIKRRIKGLQQRGPGGAGVVGLLYGWSVGFSVFFLQCFGRRGPEWDRENSESFN